MPRNNYFNKEFGFSFLAWQNSKAFWVYFALKRSLCGPYRLMTLRQGITPSHCVVSSLGRLKQIIPVQEGLRKGVYLSLPIKHYELCLFIRWSIRWQVHSGSRNYNGSSVVIFYKTIKSSIFFLRFFPCDGSLGSAGTVN